MKTENFCYIQKELNTLNETYYSVYSPLINRDNFQDEILFFRTENSQQAKNYKQILDLLYTFYINSLTTEEIENFSDLDYGLFCNYIKDNFRIELKSYFF